MTEWRVIPGFERYEVSDDGRVRFIATGRERKLRANERGYLCVAMNPGPATKPVAGKRTRTLSCKVHRLVAAAFIPNPEGLPQVNHIDRDKAHNAVANLEWIDNLSNHRHSAPVFLAVNNPKRFHKLSPEDVADIRRRLGEGERKGAIAERYGVHLRTISRINKNETRRHEASAAEHTPAPRERPPGAVCRYADRDAAIVALRDGGASIAAIAARYDLNHKRVSTIIWQTRQKAALPSRDDVQER